MAVISVSIIESTEQIVSGIPKTITITSNVASTIFFTLNGSIPNLNSEIYTGSIFLSTSQLTVILNVFATNGVDSSPIITEIYQTDVVSSGARLPHAPTNVPAGANLPINFPFGDAGDLNNGVYLNPADAGVTVDNPNLPATPTAFDGKGNPINFTNEPFDIINYNIKYSTQDAEGRSGREFDMRPGVPTILPIETSGPETSEEFSNNFDRKAFVVYQDFRNSNPNDPQVINRDSFSGEDIERARDGAFLTSVGLDGITNTGSFVRSEFNSSDNTITFYYFDSINLKWLISKAPAPPKTENSFDGNLSVGVVGRNRFVYEWQNYARRVLF